MAKRLLRKNDKEKNQYTSEWYGFNSLILTIITIVVWTFVLISTKGSFSEGDSGSNWWWLILYYIVFGFIAAILSVILGIAGLFSKKPQTAFLSLSLRSILIIVLIAMNTPFILIKIAGIPLLIIIVIATIISLIKRYEKYSSIS